MKHIRIDQERIVFAAILRKGVPTVPKWMKEEAQRISKLVNRTIRTFGGNFEEVWFYFDQDLSEEEAEVIDNDEN